MLKADPYANYAELRPDTASSGLGPGPIISGAIRSGWTETSEALDTKTAPMSVYEVHLGSWMRKPAELDENGERKERQPSFIITGRPQKSWLPM